MKPFPKMEDYDHEYADIIDVELPAYHRARADWYASEVVPLLKALRNEIYVADIGDWNLIDRIDAVLRELEG